MLLSLTKALVLTRVAMMAMVLCGGTCAIAQMASPWSLFYEVPLQSSINEKFLVDAVKRVGLDSKQVVEAQKILQRHVERWEEFVGRWQGVVDTLDNAVAQHPTGSFARFESMTKREEALEKAATEQHQLDTLILDELRAELYEEQVAGWEALMQTRMIDSMRKGPRCFAEEPLCMTSLLIEAGIEVDQLPDDRRADLLSSIDGWRRSLAAAARNVVDFQTQLERHYHRALWPDSFPMEEGGLAFNSASPSYAERMKANRRRMLQVHGAARDANRQGANVVAAALDERDSLAFQCEYWLAAIPREDRRRFEDLKQTYQIISAQSALDAKARSKLVTEWQALRWTWIEHARALAHREDQSAVARIEGQDPERTLREATKAREALRETERLVVLVWNDALGEHAASVLYAEGVPTWIKEVIPRHPG